jgi:transposase
MPGEQAQVDWAHFGTIGDEGSARPLMAFVMVLSHSRRIFLRFFRSGNTAAFFQGHVEAFQAFCGVPRECLYDNLKSAVLERQGAAIRFNPQLLELATHYRFEPKPVNVARGNEKGRVERAIRYIREGFFTARTFTDIDDLNAQARAWCEGDSSDRRHPEQREQTVRDVFHEEKGTSCTKQ